jgi:hypothetical protein
VNQDTYCIEILEEHEKVNLYSIRFENEELTEVEKFFRRFEGLEEYNEDLEAILYYIDKIAEKGALERYFRVAESKMRDGVCAIPIETSRLRLYCLRLSDEILILGNGGVKDRKTYNDTPLLNNVVKLLSRLDDWIKSRIKDNRISLYGKEIRGQITFFVKTP